MAKFKIVLKGEEDPIIIDYKEGMQLAEDIRNKKVTGLIKVAGQYITVGSIKAILPIQDVTAASIDLAERRAQEDYAWRMWKTERLAMSPKLRAHSTAFMDLMCQGIRGRRLTEEEKVEVRAAQEKYFEEHPEAHNANPRCYFTELDISHAKAGLPNNDKMPPSMKDRMATYVLNFAERHLTA